MHAFFSSTQLAERKDMDSGTTRNVSHNATDMELQEFSIPSQNQRHNASYAGTRVGDGRHEYGKRHAEFRSTIAHINTSVTSHSPPNFSFKSINFNLITSNR